MKYLDENGLRHLWGKIQELGVGNGTGGSGGVTHFEKEYISAQMEVSNPTYYSSSIDTNELPEDSSTEEAIEMTNLFYKYVYLKAGELVHLFEKHTDLGYYTTNSLDDTQKTILVNILSTVDATFQLLTITEGAWMSVANDPFGDMMNGIPVGVTFVTLKGYLNVSNNDGSTFILPIYMVLYANQISTNETDFYTLKRIAKIPVKTALNPVLLWEGEINPPINISINDSPDKFRVIALIYYDVNGNGTLKTSYAHVPITGSLTFDVFVQNNGVEEKKALTMDITYPNTLNSYNYDFDGSIYIVAVYGIY